METSQKLWNKHQAELRRTLLSFKQSDRAVQLFLQQHAALHSRQIEPATLWSYEDELLDDLTEAQWRAIPKNGQHSIAWCVWHLARIEDITMHMLLAGQPQLLQRGGWFKKMKTSAQDTGNTMSAAAIRSLSETVAIQTLRKYRMAVGRSTRALIPKIPPALLKQKVDPARLQTVLDEGAVERTAQGLIEYWGGLTYAGLLLMPPTRHLMVHLNEIAKLKRKVAMI